MRTTTTAAAPGGAALVTDIILAGLGAASLATEEVGHLVGRLEDTTARTGKRARARLSKLSEELGEAIEDTVPGFVRKPIGRLTRDLEKTAKARRKELSRRTTKLGKEARKLRGRLLDQGAAVLERAARGARSAGDMVGSGLGPLLHGIGLATRGDLERIEGRLDRIDAALRKLEGRR